MEKAGKNGNTIAAQELHAALTSRFYGYGMGTLYNPETNLIKLYPRRDSAIYEFAFNALAKMAVKYNFRWCVSTAPTNSLPGCDVCDVAYVPVINIWLWQEV